MSELFPMSPFVTLFGQPTSLEQDPRKGIQAIWGSRETGAFAIARGPTDTTYEVNLIPAPDSDISFQSARMNAVGLNRWVEQYRSTILAVLQNEPGATEQQQKMCQNCEHYWPEAPDTDGRGGCLLYMDPTDADFYCPSHQPKR